MRFYPLLPYLVILFAALLSLGAVYWTGRVAYRKKILAVLRFSSLFLLVVMLLSPGMLLRGTDFSRSNLIFLLDGSASMSAADMPGKTTRFDAARAALEQEVFSPGAKTKIFHFSDEQKSQFIRTFHTPENRFLQLPPAANQDCRRGGDYAERRAAMRRRFSAGESELVLVQIATNMMRKGVDRSILAVASLPEEIRARVRLCLVGRELPKLRQLVAEQHLENQVFFEGVQYKVRDYLFAADFLLHPARVEVTGPMLLEALDAGVPVLCTDLCGYAPCVVKSHAGGTVAGKAFDQMELNVSLLSFLWNPEQLRELSGYALDFMKHHDSFAYADAVVDAMEQKGTSYAAR